MTKLLGVEPAEPPKHEHDGAEFPKWVVPHVSHVDPKGRALEFHGENKDRAGKLTVLVHDAAEEAIAVAAKAVAKAAEKVTPVVKKILEVK